MAERDAAVHAARSPARAACARACGRYTSRQSWTRSSTGRGRCFWRVNLEEAGELTHAPPRPAARLARRSAATRVRGRAQRALVVARHHLDERAERRRPVASSKPVADRAPGRARVPPAAATPGPRPSSVGDRLELRPSRGIAARRERHRRRRARRRCRRSCPPRSCARCVPSTTTRPPVMYSQPWSPTPFDHGDARRCCARQSARPATPRMKASPLVAP